MDGISLQIPTVCLEVNKVVSLLEGPLTVSISDPPPVRTSCTTELPSPGLLFTSGYLKGEAPFRTKETSAEVPKRLCILLTAQILLSLESFVSVYFGSDKNKHHRSYECPPPGPDNVWSPWSQFTTSTVYPSAFSLFRNKVGNMMTHWDRLAETAFHLTGSPLTHAPRS